MHFHPFFVPVKEGLVAKPPLLFIYIYIYIYIYKKKEGKGKDRKKKKMRMKKMIRNLASRVLRLQSRVRWIFP